MPNLRGKTWTTTTPANVEDAQYWEDHLISDEAAAKAASSVQSVNNTAPDANGNVDVVALPSGGTAGQVLTKQSSTAGDADWADPASSGHTIQNPSGTDMTYRENLQFLNAEVTDDSTNDRTIVDCKGEKGDPGQAATVSVGTTTTLNPGSSATVTNSGTTSAAVFNFGIPRGADGTDGTDGEDGVSVTGVQLLSTSGRVKTYRMSFSNGTHFDYDVTDGADGSGAGDMLKSDYDANSAVYNAGGIAAYVAGQAYSLPTASSSTLGGVKVGTNLSISDGVLSATNTDSLSGLTDTSISTPSAGQVLKYNATSSKWENAAESTGSSTLSGLSDVSLTDLSANQFLRYNATTQKWENYSLSAASSSNMGLIKLGAGLTVNQQGATDVDLTTTTYDNTTSGLSATTAKGAIDENAADIANKHKITQKAVDITSGWTQDSTSQSGSTFYKKQITLNHIYVDSPTVEIGAYNAVLPTTAQQTTYDYLRYVTVDDTVPCIYLYADENMMSDSDRTSFYIDIEGAD